MSAKLVYYIIQLLEGLGMGSFFPIYAPWLELHGLNFLKMGYVNFFYHISSSILDPFTGFIADKFGKRKSFIVGQILWTSTQYIYGASSNIFGFLVAEGIAAIGHSLKSDALESWLQNRIGKEESSIVMGKSKILFTIGQIVSSITAGYISVIFSMKIAWFVSGTLFLVATVLGGVVLILTENDANEEAKTDEISLREIFLITFSNKTITSAMLLIVAYSFAIKPIFMFWPQIIANLKMPDILRGWAILTMALPALGGSLLAGHNMFFTQNKRGLYKVIIVLSIGMTICGNANNLNLFFVGLTITELAYGAIRIVTYGHIYDEVLPQHRSTVNSLISSVHTLGGASSLLIMGQIADVYSPQFALTTGSIFLIFTLLISYIIKKIRS